MLRRPCISTTIRSAILKASSTEEQLPNLEVSRIQCSPSARICTSGLAKQGAIDSRTDCCPCSIAAYDIACFVPPSNAGHQARRAAGARYERTLFAVACMPLLGAGSGTGHRLAAPSVRRPFETPMDQFVWEHLSFAPLARSLL